MTIKNSYYKEFKFITTWSIPQQDTIAKKQGQEFPEIYRSIEYDAHVNNPFYMDLGI